MNADDKLLILVGLVVRRRRNQAVRRIWRRNIIAAREESGFFNNLVSEMRLNDTESFVNFFRMTPNVFDELLGMIGPQIQKKTTFCRKPVSPAERLAVTLRYLASGDSMVSLSYAFRLGKSTISEIIFEVCAAIWDNLMPRYLPARNKEKWFEIASDFEAKWNFPNCIVAIDGKHIVIQAPDKSGSEFFNYKHSFSIVLLGVCDANYKFTIVDIGASGRQSDGGIFRNSAFGRSLENGYLDIPDDSPVPRTTKNLLPYAFVADEAFPLKENIMRPYPGRSLTLEKLIFNYTESRSRRVIENTFGIMASRFRISRKPIIAKVSTVENVTKAVVCLHNFLKSKDEQSDSTNKYCPQYFMDFEDDNGVLHPGQWRNHSSAGITDLTRSGSNMYGRRPAEIRDSFMQFFNGDGRVPWQLARVTATS